MEIKRENVAKEVESWLVRTLAKTKGTKYFTNYLLEKKLNQIVKGLIITLDMELSALFSIKPVVGNSL